MCWIHVHSASKRGDGRFVYEGADRTAAVQQFEFQFKVSGTRMRETTQRWHGPGG